MTIKKTLTYAGIALFTLLLLLVSRFYHTDGVWFPINTVKVEGRYNYVTRQYVASVVTPYLSEGFWGISLGHIGKELKGNGWIKKTHLERVWPDTILVRIVEYEPMVRFGDNTVIDKNGHIFTPPPKSIPDSIPRLRSDEGLTRSLLQEYKKISKILSQAHLNVVDFHKDSRTLRLRTQKGLQLVVSNKGFIAELQRFVDVYPKITQEKKAEIARIDLRYQHGMAVQWK